MSRKKRIFSCPECGETCEAYPPSDQHTNVSLEPPKNAIGTVIEIIHDCKNCKHPITLYWYRLTLVRAPTPFHLGMGGVPDSYLPFSN